MPEYNAQAPRQVLLLKIMRCFLISSRPTGISRRPFCRRNATNKVRPFLYLSPAVALSRLAKTRESSGEFSSALNALFLERARHHLLYITMVWSLKIRRIMNWYSCLLCYIVCGLATFAVTRVANCVTCVTAVDLPSQHVFLFLG